MTTLTECQGVSSMALEQLRSRFEACKESGTLIFYPSELHHIHQDDINVCK